MDIRLIISVDDTLGQLLMGKLNEISEGIKQILAREAIMSVELDALTAQVQANTDVENSALVLIQGLHDQLVAAGTDPAKLSALKTALKSSADALAAAVAANTTTP